MEEKTIWEEIVRSKLKDFEVDVQPDDWKAIESRLPGKKTVFSRRWYYAAAAITIFLLITGGYYYFNNSDEIQIVAERIATQTGEIEEIEEIGEIGEIGEVGEAINNYESRLNINEKNINNVWLSRREAITNSQNRGVNYETGNSLKTATVKTSTNDLSLLPLSSKEKFALKHNYSIPETLDSLKQSLMNTPITKQIEDFQYIADAAPLKTINKSSKRWAIGAGGGSYSVGTNGGGFTNIARSNTVYSMASSSNGEWYMDAPRRNDNFNDFLANSSNLLSDNNEANVPIVDVSHKQPISFGIGVGYALNNRWSLQSGLVYTLLLSEWKTTLEFQGKSKQQLHFVGVPLGISYKIAEWNKFLFYATMGGMAEWNMGGNIKTDYYFFEDEAYRTEKEHIRMKEMQWSVNMRVGATYPIIKFVNAYVEGGANYYFNNHSSIKTIRSDKPFHVTLQAGLRFGF